MFMNQLLMMIFLLRRTTFLQIFTLTLIYQVWQKKDLTLNADCSASTRFQIVNHADSTSNSTVMCDVSVQKNLTLDTNISDDNFENFPTMNALIVNHTGKHILRNCLE